MSSQSIAKQGLQTLTRGRSTETPTNLPFTLTCSALFWYSCVTAYDFDFDAVGKQIVIDMLKFSSLLANFPAPVSGEFVKPENFLSHMHKR